jgi:hypothetical protein
MLVAGLPLAPTTGLAERNTPQAMRCCLAQWGFVPPTGVPTKATLPELLLTSVSARDSSSHRLSWQPAHPRLGQPAQAADGSSPEPRFHIMSADHDKGGHYRITADYRYASNPLCGEAWANR